MVRGKTLWRRKTTFVRRWLLGTALYHYDRDGAGGVAGYSLLEGSTASSYKLSHTGLADQWACFREEQVCSQGQCMIIVNGKVNPSQRGEGGGSGDFECTVGRSWKTLGRLATALSALRLVETWENPLFPHPVPVERATWPQDLRTQPQSRSGARAGQPSLEVQIEYLTPNNSTKWHCWCWRQHHCFFKSSPPSHSLTRMERWQCQNQNKLNEWLERTSLVKKKTTDNCHRQVWKCDNAFYQKLAPVEWQRECAGNPNLYNPLDIDNFHHSDVFLNRYSSSHSSPTNKKEPGTCSYERRPRPVPQVFVHNKGCSPMFSVKKTKWPGTTASKEARRDL